MPNPTEQRIAEIRKALAAATPGPWRNDPDENGRHFQIWGPNGPGHGLVAHAAPWCPPTTGIALDIVEANAALIAHAPEWLAWLIEQVEAAQRETWLEAAKVADARAKFLESVRTQSEGWFAISELKGIAAALRAKAEGK